jgi:hypothetical protein
MRPFQLCEFIIGKNETPRQEFAVTNQYAYKGADELQLSRRRRPNDHLSSFWIAGHGLMFCSAVRSGQGEALELSALRFPPILFILSKPAFRFLLGSPFAHLTI